jgi:phosphatidylinositol-3,4,5-trisphosphate 3-phosphatase/dual-specificity protein phosphatase PTEN
VTEHISLGNTGSTQMHVDTEPKSDAGGGAVPALEVPNTDSEFKEMAADASVFIFGDDEDLESKYNGLNSDNLYIKWLASCKCINCL